MSAHTPGPWHYKPHVADSNYMLIFCSSDQHEGDTLRGYCGEANARLISAAPELLAALKAAMAFIDAHVADPDITHEMTWRYAELLAAKPEAAIAKAEGRA